jgi:hypothetical protein
MGYLNLEFRRVVKRDFHLDWKMRILVVEGNPVFLEK